MDFGLKGKTALVLGGGGGLGRAISKALAGEGVNVAVADIEAKAIAETEAAVAAIGGKSTGLVWDLADLSQIDAHISKIESVFGPVDILVNNTGGPPPTPASGQDPALWMKHFQSMVLSVIAITDRVLPNMKARKWGRIITSTSSGVVAPILIWVFRMRCVYRWSGGRRRWRAKSARMGLPRILFCRAVLRRTGSNSWMRPRRSGKGGLSRRFRRRAPGRIPVGRYGKPEEYGDVVTFLASERAAYLTGSVICVDGGLIGSV